MKKFLVTVFIFTLVLALPLTSRAVSPILNNILINVRSSLWAAFIIFATIMFIYAGVLFFTARGDPEQMNRAKRAVIYGISGIVAAILGYGVVGMVSRIMGV